LGNIESAGRRRRKDFPSNVARVDIAARDERLEDESWLVSPKTLATIFDLVCVIALTVPLNVGDVPMLRICSSGI